MRRSLAPSILAKKKLCESAGKENIDHNSAVVSVSTTDSDIFSHQKQPSPPPPPRFKRQKFKSPSIVQPALVSEEVSSGQVLLLPLRTQEGVVPLGSKRSFSAKEEDCSVSSPTVPEEQYDPNKNPCVVSAPHNNLLLNRSGMESGLEISTASTSGDNRVIINSVKLEGVELEQKTCEILADRSTDSTVARGRDRDRSISVAVSHNLSVACGNASARSSSFAAASSTGKFRPPTSTSAACAASANGQRAGTEDEPSQYYSVLYCVRKKNVKRKGPWSDGVLVTRGRRCTLQDLEGKIVSKESVQGCKDMPEGASLQMSKFEVEVLREASNEEYSSGTLFMGAVATAHSDDVDGHAAQSTKKPTLTSFQPVRLHAPLGRAVRTPPHMLIKEDSLVLNTSSNGEKTVLVIVDSWGCYGSWPLPHMLLSKLIEHHVASKLRPHQRDGVKFMYECVMGLRATSFYGCLLADEMGLGKTLQVIALIWTLIQQGPAGHPALKRAVVICPSSLVQNWEKEVQKWLGSERLRPLVVHGGTTSKEAKQKCADFKSSKLCPLLITSYELLRKYQDTIASAKPGLLVCDEAHRLKNCSGNKTIDALLGLECPRRILLTGTPVQNDLNEFYAMIDFANPSLLGPLAAFKRLYADPIQRSRDRDASEEEQEVGHARSLELQKRTRFCILRRTADINKKYLPTKSEFVVFCRLQPLQISLYEMFVKSTMVDALFSSSNTSATILSAIGILRKLCNHPRLVLSCLKETSLQPSSESPADVASMNRSRLKAQFNEHFQASVDDKQDDWSLSGKLACLTQLLKTAYMSSVPNAREKVVVVSNFTQTLDVIQELCTSQGWPWLRLDGSTEASTRQSLVDQFNSCYGERFVFLLSSKAGGTGLNLIGASRLVLFDPDWNPATDAQAMARIWREGQLKPVIIYRLLSTGSIEEKIYQRQIMKGEVAAAVEEYRGAQFGVDTGGRHFSREELRELFMLHLDTQCDTFDLLSRSDNQGAGEWKDYSWDVDDPGLQRAILSGVVTFVYKKKDQETTIAPACEPTSNAYSVLEMCPKSSQTGELVSTKSLESGREAPWCESSQKDGPQTGSKVSTIVEDLDINYFSARERIHEEAMSSHRPSQTGEDKTASPLQPLEEASKGCAPGIIDFDSDYSQLEKECTFFD